MPHLRAIVICLFYAFVPTNALAASLTGYWYGQGYQPILHEVTQFIAHHGEDGAFEIQFRVYKNCVLTFDQREAGTWMMLNPDGYRIVTTLVNGIQRRLPDVDDYRIQEMTDQEVRYVHLSTAVEYSAKRVDEKFTFPNCESIS